MKSKYYKVFLLALLVSGVLFTALIEHVKADPPLNAQDFIMNGEYSADQWITETDTDGLWYRVTVPSDGLIELRIMSYCSGSLYFALHNEDLSEHYKFSSCSDYISAGSDDTPSTGTVSKSLSKGVYYLHVYDSVGRFKLMGKHTSYKAKDAGADSYDSPLLYKLTKTMNGALTETDTEDWYKVVLTKNGKHEIKMTSYCEGALYYEVWTYDKSQRVISSYCSGGSLASPIVGTSDAVLKKGTYYIHVYNTQGKYKFTMKRILEKISVSVYATKGTKKITIYTVPSAKVVVQYNGGKKYSKKSNSQSGIAQFTINKKMKKGKKIKITITKEGYKKLTKTVKVY